MQRYLQVELIPLVEEIFGINTLLRVKLILHLFVQLIPLRLFKTVIAIGERAVFNFSDISFNRFFNVEIQISIFFDVFRR